MVELGQARRADRDAIAALLASAGLPHADFEPHLATFTVARDGARLVGVIGLEVHGRDGVLRSLAVADAYRGRGIGRRLYASLLASARAAGVTRLFLLAPMAQTWFRLLGFRAVDPEGVPERVYATEEFRERAKGALLMVRPVPAA